MTTTVLSPYQRHQLLAQFGLRPHASLDDIRKAWKAQVRALHRNDLDAAAQAKLSTLNAAWDMLRTSCPTTSPIQAAPLPSVQLWRTTMAQKTYHRNAKHAFTGALLPFVQRLQERTTRSNPTAARLGLPLRSSVHHEPITVHVSHHVRVLGAQRQPLVLFSSQMLPGRNILVFPIFHPDALDEAGHFGYTLSQVIIGPEGPDARKHYKATTDTLDEPVQFRFSNLTTPFVLDTRTPCAPALQACPYALPVLVDAATRLDTTLGGTAKPYARPLLRLLARALPKASPTVSRHPQKA